MDYQIYNPDIATTTVIDPYDDPAGLIYVSNSSLAHWGGQFWAIMDGSLTGISEGADDQQTWLTTSEDGATWTTAVQPFRDGDYCDNPISGSAKEWQPNLVVVGDELWCTWYGQDGYLSTLSSLEGKWVNHRFEFDGTDVYLSDTITGDAEPGRAVRPTINGISDWLPFFTQNPIVLSSGVVACPLTFYSTSNFTEQIPSTASTFTRYLKFNALLCLDDGSWSMVLIDTADFGDSCPWEPFIVEDGGGYVYVYSRNLNTLTADPDFQLVAKSSDGGATFAPSISTKMLVPSTRGFARQISGNRWVMVHCDRPQNSNQTPTQSLSLHVRRNGALFVSRKGIDDFVPGLNFSGYDTSMNYPQFIIHDDALYVHWTSGVGRDIRRSLKLVKIDPIPDNSVAYVHPRSVNAFTHAVSDPTLVGDTPPFYEFDGLNQARSVTTLAASTGVTYTAWLQREWGGEVIADSRGSGATTFGQVFVLNGMTIRSLNFFHDFFLIPGVATFHAAVIDNAAGTVTLYANNGGGLLTKTCYFKSILFGGQPSDGDTLTVDAVTYTFRTSATLANDVAVGADLAATVVNLRAKLTGNAVTSDVPPGGDRVLLARVDRETFSVSSGSAQVTVDATIPLGGGVVGFGKAISSTSTLSAFVGQLYEARVYDSVLTEANLASLYDGKAAALGHDPMGGGSAPGSPFLIFDPEDPDLTEFPSLGVGAPGRCEVVSETLLRIHGEGSAAVELPSGVTRLDISYKLGAIPEGSDKYVIATFGTVDSPLQLHISATNPTHLYANAKFVSTVTDPTEFSSITVDVYTNKIKVGDFEHYFAGRPRCYLGGAFPEGLLAETKTIEYDVAAMEARRAAHPLQ